MMRKILFLATFLLPAAVLAGGPVQRPAAALVKSSASRPARAEKARTSVRRSALTARTDEKKTEVIGRPIDTHIQQARILGEKLKPAPFKADYVDVGMGPTGMMTMLSAIATGHPTIGVEIRGAPQRGVHQNIRIDWFHTLAKIDQMMAKRYGADGVPKLPNGKPFILHDFFYNKDRVGGHLDFPEVFGVGDEQNQNLAGRLTKISFEDARDTTLAANGGKAKLHILPPPAIPEKADPKKLNPDMRAVLDSPSTFQAALINYELMLRTYLKTMQRQDDAAGRPARVRIYENHRVAQEDGLAAGYLDAENGKKRIVIEEIADERSATGGANRVRKPGTARIDLGTPTRFSLTAGFGGGADAKTLGYEQEDVVAHDPVSGKSVAAKQNWLVGEVTANVGGQLIRRISTVKDHATGESHTVRQIAVGHEDAPNVAWVPVQVPDFMDFDPIKAGKVPAGTDPKSKEFAEAKQALVKTYYIEQVSAVTHIPAPEIDKMRMFYGPNAFTLKEKLGSTARLATNGNVAGDLMGNGHFLTSGGAMTGMIGHANRYIKYWQDLDKGKPEAKAAKALEAGIKQDSEAWLHVSVKEFVDVAPQNFGAERAAAIGIKTDATALTHAESKTDHGLTSVLGQSSWAKSLKDLQAGKFGKAGVDFYVPPKQLDITATPTVTVHEIK